MSASQITNSHTTNSTGQIAAYLPFSNVPVSYLTFLIPVTALTIILILRALIRARHHTDIPYPPQFEPPPLEPAVVDHFLDGNVNDEAWPATIVDMLRRKEVSVNDLEETENETDTVPYRTITFHVKPSDVTPDRPYARVQVECATEEASAQSKWLTLSGTSVFRERRAIRQWLIEHGYYRPRWFESIIEICLGIPTILLTAVSGITLFAAIDEPVFNALAWGASLFATSIILWIGLLWYSMGELGVVVRLTPKGMEMWRYIQGFKLYILKAEGFRQQWLEREGELDRYLPWAIIFHATDQWIRSLEDNAIQYKISSQPIEKITSKLRAREKGS